MAPGSTRLNPLSLGLEDVRIHHSVSRERFHTVNGDAVVRSIAFPWAMRGEICFGQN